MATLKILDAGSKAGQRKIQALTRRGEGLLDGVVVEKTRRIVDKVRKRGDDALLDFVRRFDGFDATTATGLRRVPGEASGELPGGFPEALERAIARVERYHRKQRHDGFTSERDGVTLVERRQPLSRVGVYIPGGRATYPSSVLMTVIPARLAGVPEVVVTTPPAAFDASPALRFTLERLGVEEVWGMGGAHAVSALAYGTESVERVDKIVGPGNAWVTAAKHLVSGEVAIDGLAGPSEVVIIAAAEAGPEWLAADLLAQAEHDPQALPLLLTDDKKLAKKVAKTLEKQLSALPTAAVAKAAVESQGAALVMSDLEAAAELADALAPEHLQLVGAAAEALVERIHNAAAVFVGAHTPEVFGDYVAGPSHVLPTAGTARFTSALGVEDFVRRSHVVRFTPGAAARLAHPAAVLADVEGLPAHAAAARLRREKAP